MISEEQQAIQLRRNLKLIQQNSILYTQDSELNDFQKAHKRAQFKQYVEYCRDKDYRKLHPDIKLKLHQACEYLGYEVLRDMGCFE